MATLKHINSKNADYGAAEQYLLFEHDEFTMKPVLDETGRLVLGGIGALVYFKFIKQKPKTKGSDNLDDYDYGEDDTEQEDADPWETEESDEPEDADGGGDEESENPAK